MFRYPAVIVSVLFVCMTCLGDTFTHRTSVDSFNGYIVSRKRGNRTQVRIEKRKPRYLDLSNYKVERNYLGRKNRVYTFGIKDAVGLVTETEAFEKSVRTAANQGPLFILIEIDTPGGRIDLAKRICSAITNLDNCTTVAFISGDKFGGAFSAGAIISLACDRIYMLEGTAIGAASLYAQTASGPEELKDIYGESIAEKFSSAWSAYCVALAELNDRPGQLVRAMVEKQAEAIEIIEDGKRAFIDPKNKPEGQKTIRTWGDKNSLLTLTADEAVVTGIADRKVSSKQELLVFLKAEKAAERPDRNALKARRVFEKAKAKFDAILNSIDYLEQRANILVKEYNSFEAELRKVNRVAERERYGRRRTGFYGSTYSEVMERKRIFSDRDVLLDDILNVLDELISEYKAALAMAKKYTDLNHYVRTLEKSLTKTEATYDEVSFRFGY